MSEGSQGLKCRQCVPHPSKFPAQLVFLGRPQCSHRTSLVAVEAQHESWKVVDEAFAFADSFWTGSCLQTTAKEQEGEKGDVKLQVTEHEAVEEALEEPAVN